MQQVIKKNQLVFLTSQKKQSLAGHKLDDFDSDFSSHPADTLKKHGLDPKYIVSQGYDGASVMSGKNSGVQKLIKEVAP
uniref:Uncharacterized protein n=1 Tax=Amphimedon queenslandica TaxID=400682 RepID=A0A1X7TMX2_AMPQE